MIAIFGIIIVCCATLLALTVFKIARRFNLYSHLGIPTAAVGPVFTIAGTLFSILVAFSIVIVWGSYGRAISVAAEEADALGNLERMSRSFSVPIRRQVQEAVSTYADMVVDEEWEAMKEAKSSQRADAVLNELWHVYLDMDAVERAHAAYSQSLATLNEVTSYRRLRLLTSDDRIPSIMWALIIIDGSLLVLLATLFEVKNVRGHSVLIGLIAVIVSLALFLIATLDNPYGGLLAIEPEAFEFVQENLQSLEI